MRRFNHIALFTIIAFAIISGCVKPYQPKPILNNSNVLVVEGHISTNGFGSTINLSHTVPLSSTYNSIPEANATVSVTSDNFELQFFNNGNGSYYQDVGDLSVFKNLRLKIVTADGKIYESDIIPVKDAPPIDSVYYRVQKDGVHIYADAHDPTNRTRYYRWDYNETFIIHSSFYSFNQYDPSQNAVVLRYPANQVYQCWQSDNSTNIVLGSSQKLVSDIVVGNPIAFVPSASEKLGDRYSILVNQYALSADEYNYYVQIKKITEQLGSIFDAQPSEISGNIHCTTVSKEPVIGFIGAGASTQTRIFIDSRNLPAWVITKPYPDCTMDTMYFDNPVTHVNDVIAYIYTGDQIPIVAIQSPGGPVVGYSAAPPECVDCTLRGTNIQPSFWK